MATPTDAAEPPRRANGFSQKALAGGQGSYSSPPSNWPILGEAIVPEQARHTSPYDRIKRRKRRMFAMQTAGARDIEGQPDKTSATTANTVQMPIDGWLYERTLQRGPDTEVRLGTKSSTQWGGSDKGILPVSLGECLTLLDQTS